MPRIAPKLLWLGLLTPTLFGFDFASKRAVVQQLGPRDVVPVLDGWLAFVHAENPGAMFSMPLPLPLIAVAGVVVLWVLLRMMRALPDAARLPALALALLASGAAGNLADRLGDGTVTDFIQVSAAGSAAAPWLVDRFGTATWPIFNLADIWLVVGVAMLAVMPRSWMERAPAAAPA